MKKLTLLMAALLSANVFAAGNDQHDMDHSKMDHSQMDHSKMDHSKMDHSSMHGSSTTGMPAKGAKPDKVVHVLLADDMSITFKRDVMIEADDVVQFVVLNTGKMEHEFVIGSKTEQAEHREMMKTMSTHDMENSVVVAPGKAKQILWHFHGDSEVELACNMPGHYEAGMIKKLSL